MKGTYFVWSEFLVFYYSYLFSSLISREMYSQTSVHERLGS